jgi:hypothetical protein
VRKIISILIALGLVLAFSVVALPTSAANTCSGTVVMVSGCAGATDTYNITFKSPVTLLPGNDGLSVTFGAGTSLAGVNSSFVSITDITLATAPANPTSVTKTGTKIEFPTPIGVVAGDTVEIIISHVVNPAGGPYTMVLDYKLLCCGPFDFCTVDYTIKPASNTYYLMVDFGPTYSGIAKDFVPPFKACGQNNTGTFNTTQIGTSWYDQFDLTLVSNVTGCAVPCTNMTLFVDLVAYPTATAKASLNVTTVGLPIAPVVSLNSSGHNTTAFYALNVTPTGTGLNTTMHVVLHFDTPGTTTQKFYKIYFKVFCPPSGTPTCDNGCLTGVETKIAEATYTFNVFQWKDAYKVILDEKWNLISLPLVPLVDPPIADLLKSINPTDRAQIDSIWYYDNCKAGTEAQKWSMWPSGGLTDLVDGKAYWLKVMPYNTADCGNITWWVFGTEKPMPPASPAQYKVCEGWNMVGFLGTAANVSAYLWNWAPAPVVVYGWHHGCFAAQTWELKTAGDPLVLGQGYWMAFPAAGAVYVP